MQNQNTTVNSNTNTATTSIKDFVSNLVAENGGSTLLKRKVIINKATAHGFTYRDICRHMLRPSMKAGQRGMYNVESAITVK